MVTEKYNEPMRCEIYIDFQPDLEKERVAKEVFAFSPLDFEEDLSQVINAADDNKFVSVAGVLVRKRDLAYIDVCYDEMEAEERYKYYEIEYLKERTKNVEGKEEKANSDIC